jgi:glycosyltransferase involved in cell wall biosynthesis
MSTEPDVTLITECFNLQDGQSIDGLVAAIAVLRDIAHQSNGEVLVMDGSADSRVVALIPDDARVRRIEAPDLGYDELKNLGAELAQGAYVAYLDGDCRPRDGDWLDRLLAPIRAGQAEATGGLTVYDDPSAAGIAASIMDFGYAWDDPHGRMGCYSSNNVAFSRTVRCDIPVAASDLRCNCYAHTQELWRRGKRVQFVPQAVTLHEPPDVASERYRRGWDVIAACWSNPLQVEALQLLDTPEALAWQQRRIVHFDVQRMRRAPVIVGLRQDNLASVWSELQRLRALEAEGMRDAVRTGERDGRNAEARSASRHWFATMQSAHADA